MNDQQLAQLLTPVLEQFELELESLDSARAGKRRVLRVVVDGDGPDGRGPTLDDIAEATKAISETLDDSDTMGEQPYTLEVSSRGLGRPLTAAKHWRRNHGRLVTVTFDEGEPVTGRIVDSSDEGATIEVVVNPKKKETTQRQIAYAEVVKAVIQPELTKGDSGDAENKNEEI